MTLLNFNPNFKPLNLLDLKICIVIKFFEVV